MKASVIISAYNSAEFIARTINSVLDQNIDDYEILIVDDGSTDETKSIVCKFSDSGKPVRYIYQENSGGPSRPRNVGIREAKGEFLFILDSDDIMLPGKMKAQINALEKYKDAAASFTQFQSVDENGEIIQDDFLRDYQTLWNLLPNGPHTICDMISSEDMFGGLTKANFVGTSSVAMRASTVRNAFEFDESMSNSDDLLMWATLARNHSWVFLGQPYHQYRIRRQSITSRDVNRRAESIVYGLNRIREMCVKKSEVQSVNKKLSEFLISLAYNQRQQYQFTLAFRTSLRAIRYRRAWVSIRMLLSVFWFWVRHLLR